MLKKLVPGTCTDDRDKNSKIVPFDWSVVFESFWYQKLAWNKAQGGGVV